MGGDLGGTGSGAGIEPPFAVVHVSCQAGVLGWLQSFPHQCLAGTSKRTSHKVRLLLYLAMWSIASWHTASTFFQGFYLQGNKITSLLLRLSQCAIFSLLPKSRIACHLCLSTLASLFSPMPILGAVFFHRPPCSRTWFICTSGYTNLLLPYLSNKATLMQLPFAKSIRIHWDAGLGGMMKIWTHHLSHLKVLIIFMKER